MNTKIEAATRYSARNKTQSERADNYALTMKPTIDDLKESGLTIHRMAEELNKRRFRTPRGHFWGYRSVFNVCARLNAITKRAKAAEVTEDQI